MASSNQSEVDETSFLGGRLTLHQPRKGHRVGTDAALAIAAARPYARRHAVDLGAGVGAIGLSLAVLTPALDVTLVEIDPFTAGLAERNAAANVGDGRVRTIMADVRALACAQTRSRHGVALADLVVANPPFLNARQVRPSPDGARALAHVMEEGGLEQWLAAAAALLTPRGFLVLIHRPEALGTLLAGLETSFASIALRAVHPRPGEAASRILLLAKRSVTTGSAAKKGGQPAALSIKPPLILHDGPRFTPLAEAIHRGEAELPFD